MVSEIGNSPSQNSSRRSTSEPAGDRRAAKSADDQPAPEKVREIGGPKGPEPTRFGDWEKGGRCSDF
ncbi:MAG: DUF1674 domain-containing protein [Geminicoccaceae bacterium]